MFWVLVQSITSILPATVAISVDKNIINGCRFHLSVNAVVLFSGVDSLKELYIHIHIKLSDVIKHS